MKVNPNPKETVEYWTMCSLQKNINNLKKSMTTQKLWYTS